MADTSSMPVVYSGVNYSLFQSSLQPLFPPSRTLSAAEFTFSITASGAPVGLAVPSGYSATAYSFVLIYNSSSYTVYVGGSATQALPLAPGGQLSIDVKPGQAFNLASIYLSSTSGASVVVFYA